MQPTTIRLYKFDEPSNQWQLEAADVRPNFFNENEDSAAAKAKWLVEMGNVEVEVTDQFNFEESGKRVIFQGNQGIWALRFPNDRGYQDFYRQYNDKLFENTYRLQNDDANRQKVSHDAARAFIAALWKLSMRTNLDRNCQSLVLAIGKGLHACHSRNK